MTSRPAIRISSPSSTRPCGRPSLCSSYSCAALLGLRYVVEHPDRVSHLILLSGQYAESVPQPFDEKVAPVIRDDFDSWRTRLFDAQLPEPHSLKGIEDGVGVGGRDDAGHPRRVAPRDRRRERLRPPADACECRPSRCTAPRTRSCPTRTRRRWSPPSPARAWSPSRAPATRSTAATPSRSTGSSATSSSTARRARTRSRRRPSARRRRPARGARTERRILWLSSPIGLGHIQRDIAIARKLREIAPGRHRGLPRRQPRRPRRRGHGRAPAPGHAPAPRTRAPTSRAGPGITSSTPSTRSGTWTRSWPPTS